VNGTKVTEENFKELSRQVKPCKILSLK
jgi:hypothetical protein